MTDVNWQCRCGAVEVRVSGVPAQGTAAMCYCRDCRAFARLHGAEAILDQAGGTGLYSTAPDRMELLRGGELLRCHRMTARGPLRWYTSCCDTPLANTAPLRGVPFASILTGFWQTPPPRPAIRLFPQSATGKVPGRKGSMLGFVVGVARRVIVARLSGRWRTTPFFDADGQPVSAPETPDPDALRAAYGDRA